jgi:hypothetical protein
MYCDHCDGRRGLQLLHSDRRTEGTEVSFVSIAKELRSKGGNTASKRNGLTEVNVRKARYIFTFVVNMYRSNCNLISACRQ